jgi:hypothetical protein
MFKTFAHAVRQNYEKMAKSHELYIVEDDQDSLWSAYLDAFPQGTNLIFRERTEHDCSTCKRFVRHLGGIVSIKDGKLTSVWDIKVDSPVYSEVAKAMAQRVRELPIHGVFRSREKSYGEHTTRSLDAQKQLKVWHHFEGSVHPQHHCAQPGQETGRYHTASGVLRRGLDELHGEALDEIIALISGDAAAIYRGAEHLQSMKDFRHLKRQFDALDDERARELFVWEHVVHRAALFRNTVMGTLIQDLSEGRALEASVRAFELKVAPSNYKRPKALISKAMVERAMAKIEELELRTSLERRHARIEDVSVHDILFVDRSSRPLMRDALEDVLMSQVVTRPVDVSRAERIGIEEFMARVVPQCESMELRVEQRHMPHFVSLTAPVHAGEPRLFSWGNDFGWSYEGNLADSGIKQRVKAAGGNVTAPLRVSLGWFNFDDLDLHVIEPDGNHIYFGNRSGKLDVDMNVQTQGSREAVENVFWERPKDGEYLVRVNNYTRRESIDVGFALEVECMGNVQHFAYQDKVDQKQTIEALKLRIKDGKIVSLTCHNGVSEEGSGRSREHWDVTTETFTRVRTLMKSPNHWHGATHGNAHWFFILEGCNNPDPVRGMFNENLRPELHEHRKVFEVLASKVMCAPSAHQLSGVGFSSTKRANVLVKVQGQRLQGLFEVQI